MGKKVFIMSIPRESGIKLSDARGVNGEKINKTKVYRAKTSIMALYSPKVGGLNNYISYTPWIDPSTNLPAKDEKGKTIMLQEYLENKYGKEKGYYTNKSPEKSQKEEDATFFQTAYWILNDGTTVLDLDNEMDELGYYVMLGSSLVANSEKEWRAHKWPKAEFYISLENESDDIKNQKVIAKRKAFARIDPETNSQFNESYRRKFIVLLNIANTKANLSLEQVDNALYDFIDKSSFGENSNIAKINSLFELLKTAPGRENIEMRYLLAQALDNRIVYEKQGTYTWLRSRGNIVIGDRYEEAVDFLLNPKKAAEVDEIREEIKKKLI